MISNEQKQQALTVPISTLLPDPTSARQTGSNKWTTRCPFHDDTRPSFVIWRFDDGVQRFKCYACGEKGTGIDLIKKLDGCNYPQAVERILGISPREKVDLGTEVAHYDYMNEAGDAVLYRVTRFEPKAFRPSHPEGDAFKTGYGSKDRVLYHADKLTKMPEGAFVLLVEGEKDADNAIANTWDSTTWAGGADNWRDYLAEGLRDLTVIIIPDNDLPGFRAMRAASLAIIPIAKRCGWIRLGDGCKDLSDFFAAGGSMNTLLGPGNTNVHWDQPVEIPADLIEEDKKRQEEKRAARTEAAEEEKKEPTEASTETESETGFEVPM